MTYAKRIMGRFTEIGWPWYPPVAVAVSLSTVAMRLDQLEPFNETAAEEIERCLLSVMQKLPEQYKFQQDEFLKTAMKWMDNEESLASLTVPLHDLIPVAQSILTIHAFFCDGPIRDLGLFADLRRQLFLNMASYHCASIVDVQRHRVPPVTEVNEHPLVLLDKFLGGTVFWDLFHTPVPFVIPRDRGPTHAVVLAPIEWGKSELNGTFLREAIEDPEPRSVILCDPHGDLYAKALPRVPPDRLVTVDLTTNPPDLNILDRSVLSDRAALEAFRFMVSSLSGGLSPKQENCIKPLFALLGQIPDANLVTLHDIITEQVKKAGQSKFAQAIAKLDHIPRTFFENLWYSGSFSDTKEALTWKVGAALDDAVFYKMFSAKKNSIDVSSWIENDRIVLVKSSDALDKEGTRLFFLFLVGQYYAAARRRDAIPEHKRKLAMMLFDEAAVILQSPIIKDIFNEIRKYRCSFVVSTQQWSQIAEDVRPAVLGSVGIRIAGQLGTNEAKAVAPDMGIQDHNIKALRNVPRSHAEWYVYVRSFADQAIKVTAPYGQLEAMPKQKQPGRIEYERNLREGGDLIAGVAQTLIDERGIKPLSDEAAFKSLTTSVKAEAKDLKFFGKHDITKIPTETFSPGKTSKTPDEELNQAVARYSTEAFYKIRDIENRQPDKDDNSNDPANPSKGRG